MSDSYQAIYDAVRSRISGGNIGDAIRDAIREANISHYFDMAMRAAQESAWQYGTPSAVYRPKVFPDGAQWCALYGDNLVEGVAGFGNTPAAAMADFDVKWHSQKLPPKAA